MSGNRPTKLAIGAQVVGLAVVAARGGLAGAGRPTGTCRCSAILLGFSVFSDLTAITTTSKVKISGSFLALVLAMVFLGGTPAALIGVLTILAGWLRWRDAGHFLLNNLLTYATFPLVAGIAFHAVVDRAGITDPEPAFYVADLRRLPAARWRSTSR